MEQYITIEGNRGYGIKCKQWVNLDMPKEVIIACHGFAGDKESSAISMLASELLKNDVYTIAFDLPGHGESDVDGDSLTIENCLEDFKSVIDYVKREYGNVKTGIFATSFGGYLSLLLNDIDVSLLHVILRCPAIKMDKIFINEILREDIEEFKKRGYTVVGYERELKVNYSFYEELKNTQILDIYINTFSNILMIHGDKDTTAPIEDTIVFSNKFSIPLKIIEGADHRFKKPGELEKVVDYTISFINEDK